MNWHLVFILSLTGLVIAGTATAGEERSAEVVWQGVDEFENATVENSMSAAVRRPGKAGGVAMSAIFLHPQDSKRAVLTFPRLSLVVPGRRVFFLGYAGIADGFQWDEKEHPADGARFYVTIDGKDVATAHVQASKWVPLAAEVYRGPAEGGVFQPTVVLATDSGPEGNSNYDWAMFGEPLLVSLEDKPLGERVAVNGVNGVVVARLAGGTGRIAVEGLAETGEVVQGAVAAVEVAEPTELAFVRFDFSKYPACVQWRWRAEGIRVAQAWGGSLTPLLSLVRLGPSQAVTFAGELLRVRVAVTNKGLGAIVPDHRVRVECNGIARAIERLGPDETAALDFEVGQVGDELSASVYLGDNPVETITVPTPALWPKLPPLPPERPEKTSAREMGDDYVVVENPHSRWVVWRKAPGLGAVVYVWGGDRWELAGTVSPWVEVAWGQQGTRLPVFSQITSRVEEGKAELRAQVEDERCRYYVALALPDQGVAAHLQTAAEPWQADGITTLYGPAVHAGDRSTGTQKGIAIFPGLEYLEGEERSSSERDLTPPLNKRWAPHKFKVTVPMMIVETREGGPVLGVAWDPLQKWDGENIAPAARFASPDFLTHQDNHLMQLMAPSIPDFILENGDRMAPDVPVPSGPARRLALVQQIVAARPTPDATAAYEWFETLVGFPEAEAWPRSFEEEIALCRHGFMVTVWDEETKKNRHCVGWPPGNSPGMATLLLMDGRAVAQGDEKKRVLERVKLIADQTLQEEGAPGLTSSRNCHIMGWELPYHGSAQEQGARVLSASLAGMRSAAYGSLNSQEEDGGWGYYPTAERRELGEPGTRVMGIAGRNAYIMAKWVAVSGDPVVEAGLRRALEHMEQYKVPRGAQGWECPILEPDILASAYAVRAYVWSYMALGEDRWLDRARYWARTGLPFQYAWDDGQHPGMRYASIPVFGSTFFRHSWIGLPVQWCGLVYAYGLQELMRFDRNDLWRKQVEGILASAVHQQWPMDNEKLAGSYPDSYGNWFTRRNGAYINPENIALNALALRGLDPGLRSQRAEIAGGPVHVTAAGDLQAKGSGERLDVRVKYLPGEVAYVTVAPVRVAQGLAERMRETEVAYNEELRVLCVGVRCDGQGGAQFTLTGLERSVPEPARARSAWEFETDAEGWEGAHGCTVSSAGGLLRITVTGDDTYALSGPAEIAANQHKKLRVRARLTGGKGLGFFWRSTKSPKWGPDKEVQVLLEADGQWHEVVIDLSGHALWVGSILQIRLDVEPANVEPGTVLEVDWVRLE